MQDLFIKRIYVKILILINFCHTDKRSSCHNFVLYPVPVSNLTRFVGSQFHMLSSKIGDP